MRKFQTFLFTLVLAIALPGNLVPFDLQSIIGEVVGIDKGGLLLSDVEYRRKQLKDLGAARKIFKNRSKEAFRSINTSLGAVEKQEKDAAGKIKDASGTHEESLKQKQAILNDRKQNFVAFKDLWREVDGKFVDHEKLIKEIINFLQSKKKKGEEKVAYYWKDLDETKKELDQREGKIEATKGKRERLKKLSVTPTRIRSS